MRYDPERHHRRSIRLRGYDYTQAGAYFVTICTQDRECLLGEVVDGVMRLNDAGRVAEQCWLDIPNHFPHVELDAFVVMPNHVHGIIIIYVGANDDLPLRRGVFRSPSKTVGSVVRGFKIGVTKWLRANTAIYRVWQRNYYEHIIRNEASLLCIRDYIQTNPSRWHWDRENPHRGGMDNFDRWLDHWAKGDEDDAC